jgi:hypothetical protein
MSLASSIKFIYYTVYTANPEDPKELSWDQVQGILKHQRKQVKKPHGERLNV